MVLFFYLLSKTFISRPFFLLQLNFLSLNFEDWRLHICNVWLLEIFNSPLRFFLFSPADKCKVMQSVIKMWSLVHCQYISYLTFKDLRHLALVVILKNGPFRLLIIICEVYHMNYVLQIHKKGKPVYVLDHEEFSKTSDFIL